MSGITGYKPSEEWVPSLKVKLERMKVRAEELARMNKTIWKLMGDVAAEHAIPIQQKIVVSAEYTDGILSLLNQMQKDMVALSKC